MAKASVRCIMLDVDGCLNNLPYLRTLNDWHGDDAVDPKNVTCLNHLIALTDAKVVISSTWRKFKTLLDLRRILTAQGFYGDIIDHTPVLDRERGEEIQTWLDTTPYNVESFVILDDDDDMGDLAPYLVRTSFQTGLTMENVQQAAKILLAGVDHANRW